MFWGSNTSPPPPFVEVAAAETTVDITNVITGTSASPLLITIQIPVQSNVDASNAEGTIASESAKSIKATIDGTTYSDGGVEFSTVPFTTTWTYSATTLILSYTGRQTAFVFNGAVSTEITIPSEHTHLTVNGMETAVDLPGIVTTIEVSESTNVIITLPEVTTSMEIAEETYEFTVTAGTAHSIDGGVYCGLAKDEAQKIDGADTASLCIPYVSTVITLPTGAAPLYLNAPGVNTAFTLPGITTTTSCNGGLPTELFRLYYIK